jgi:hypothetical protein
MIPAPSPTVTDTLERAIGEVEARLGALAYALAARETVAIETAATALQRSLASTLDSFSRAARHGGVPPALRQRIVRASGQVAAQRETLARATVALDRALDGLLPREAAVYTASGTAALATQSGSVRV